MSWRLGILIAGSLDWRSEPYRHEWRQSRLTSDVGVLVRAPIRYGRLSGRTGHKTYTMVFAPGCPDGGTAKVRLCLRNVSSIADLLDEAKALWVAERPPNSPPLPGRLRSTDWGCVALLANPEAVGSQELLDHWAERTVLEKDQHGCPTYDSTLYAVKGISPICNRGMLQIPWPARIDNDNALDSCDFLIATATRPTPVPATGDFPIAEVIAEAWNNAGNTEYFRMNRKHGLHTFQDQEIETKLRV
jgi:hypothetical protein